MTPAGLLELSPVQRRMLRESRAAASILDRAFSARVLAGMGAAVLETGLIRRKGRVRVLRTEDRDAAKGWSAGQRVLAARHRKGWTQQDLADESGIARANIARLEGGRHAPQVDTLRRVATALGVSLSWILEEPAYAASREDRDWVEAGLEDWPKESDRDGNR